MKLEDVIKALRENPDKKYIRSDNSLELTARVKNRPYVDIGYIEFVDNRGKAMDNIDLNRKWEEVKKPVDFMTAFKAFRNKGKDIYCIYEDTRTDYFEDSDKDYCFCEDKIEHGKWYIG